MRRALAFAVLGLLAVFSLPAQTPSVAAGAAPPPRQVSVHAQVSSQPLPIDRGADAVWQSLLKLHSRASMMMIVAHPDDEDSGFLAYASRGLGARVTLVTLNRGEGGQNLKSDDFNDALGLIRTQELLAADRYYGVQEFFTPAVDFGFSKTVQETFQKWGHQRMLGQIVRLVREVRPEVLTSVFVGGPSDGHGHHEAAGELTQEVYSAAGNPKEFPEQLKEGLRPWTPLKVYARVPVNAFTPKGIYDYANLTYTPDRIYDYVNKKWINGVPSITLRVPENATDPTLHETYSQIGGQGRQWHKTQFNFSARRGPGPGRGGRGGRGGANAGTPYHLYGSRVKTKAHETSPFDGIDTSLMGIADYVPDQQSQAARSLRTALEGINGQVESAMHNFDASDPAKIAPTLAQGLAATRRLVQQVQSENLPSAAKFNIEHELTVKVAQFNNALVEALGLSLDATATSNRGRAQAAAFPGEHIDVSARLNNGPEPVQIVSIGLGGQASGSAPGTGSAHWTVTPQANTGAETLAPHLARQARFAVTLPDGAQLTKPYFSRPNIEQAYYNINDPRYRNLPQMPYSLAAWAHLSYRGVPFQFGEVVQTTANGEAEPLPVAPAISVEVAPSIGIMPLPAKPFELTVTIHGNVPGGAQGQTRLQLPAGWTAQPAQAQFSLAQAGANQPLQFKVTPPAAVGTQPVTITAVANYAGKSYRQGYRTVGYTGLRPTNYYTPSTYRTRGVNVHVASGLSVGYIPGTGDSVPAALAFLGVHVHTIAPADIANANLAAYNVIVLGIRTYNADPELRTENARLLNFVKNGGVLIVQYQSSAFDAGYGPYPYTMVGNGPDVVNEESPVTILAPNNPAMSWPNKITTADFNGWIEERGHGFIGSWSSHYTPLVSMHDPNQVPQKGGLLYANYGKGVYVYEGLALYRQLAQGVPGAYRIFANLLSLPERPGAGN